MRNSQEREEKQYNTFKRSQRLKIEGQKTLFKFTFFEFLRELLSQRLTRLSRSKHASFDLSSAVAIFLYVLPVFSSFSPLFFLAFCYTNWLISPLFSSFLFPPLFLSPFCRFPFFSFLFFDHSISFSFFCFFFFSSKRIMLTPKKNEEETVILHVMRVTVCKSVQWRGGVRDYWRSLWYWRRKKRKKRKHPANYLCPTQQRCQSKKRSRAAPPTKAKSCTGTRKKK